MTEAGVPKSAGSFEAKRPVPVPDPVAGTAMDGSMDAVGAFGLG